MITKEIAQEIEEALNSPNLSDEEKYELAQQVNEYQNYIKYNQLEIFNPYKYQIDFFEKGKTKRFRFLMAGNRLGKTHSACYETALHLTGRYPEDWKGYRFDKPIKAWSVGINAKGVADSLQGKLLGTNNVKSGNEQALGTGFIPRKYLKLDTLQRDGANAVTILVKHYDEYGNYDGDSELSFKSCAQGEHALMGSSVDWVHMDEEPPFESLRIYSQLQTRVRTNRGLVCITATPENGATELVNHFRNSKSKEEYYVQAGIPDVIPELYSEAEFEEMKLQIPKYQHGFRLYGDPDSANGVIYDVDLEAIKCEPFNIPPEWKQIAGIDLGFNHPTACVWTAYDSDNDTIYVTGEYKEDQTIPAVHTSAIRKRGDYIPVVFPHDALQSQKNTGEAMIDVYRREGMNVAYETFYNFYTTEGTKNNNVEVGLSEIRTRMKEGRLKIFSTCQNLFTELRSYRVVKGRIHKFDDDLCDAMRYSAMSVTHRGVSRDSVFNHTPITIGWIGDR